MQPAESYREHYEMLAKRNFFDELMALRDQQRESTSRAAPLLDGQQIPWELNPHGFTKWYMAPTMDDLPMNAYTMYLRRIPAGSRSGRQRAPGDEVARVWRGETGYTLIDDVRHDWKQGDVFQIPSRPEGCVVQHFNTGGEDLEIMLCRVNTAHSCGVDRGVALEQLEPCPEYAESRSAAAASTGPA